MVFLRVSLNTSSILSKKYLLNVQPILTLFLIYMGHGCLLRPIRKPPRNQRKSIVINRTIEGCAEACGAVCRLISKPQIIPILDIYLAQFYKMIELALSVDSDHMIVTSVLLNTPNLFLTNTKGLRSLITFYERALRLIFPDICIQNCTDIIAQKLRRASLTILSQIVMISNRFPGTSIPNIDRSSIADSALQTKVDIVHLYNWRYASYITWSTGLRMETRNCIL